MSDTPGGAEWEYGDDGKWYGPGVLSGAGWRQGQSGTWYRPPVQAAGYPRAPPAAPPPRASLRPALGLVVGGALIVGIGAFLPWIKVTAPFLGSVTRSGTEDGGDGWVMVGIAVALIALAWPLFTGRPLRSVSAVVVLLLALGAVGLAMVDIADVTERINDIEDDIADSGALASVGVGLYVCIAGAVLAGIGGLVELASGSHRTT